MRRIIENIALRGSALALAVAAGLALTGAPAAHAGDDGQAPIWMGIGGIIGFTQDEKGPPIDYRERARLVLPPTTALPPPLPAVENRSAAWPVDPDVEKARKAKAERLDTLKSQADLAAMRAGSRVDPTKLRVDRSAPGQRTADRCGSLSNTRNCQPTLFNNTLDFFGWGKTDDVVAGQEPDRDWLTDPPSGYRRATGNATATFEARKPRDNDPRAALYHPPDQ